MKFITLLVLLTLAAHASAPEIEWQAGKCLGNLRPSRACKTCRHCWYCGKQGKWGARPKNSAICVVCAGR